MKVLQINAVNKIRSTGRIVAELNNYIGNQKGIGYIAYSDGPPANDSFKIGNRFDTKRHALLSRISGLQAYFSKKATKKLLLYISSIKPDVVHLHNLHGNFIHLQILLKYLADNDIPTVITLHDCWFYTGKCTHYTVDNCYKWQTRCGGCPRLRKDNPSWFFDRTRKMHVDKKKWFAALPRLAVVGVSEWITGEARQSFLSSAKIITRIYNWIDLEIFKPANTSDLRHKLGLQNKFVILGVASGWGKSKGLDKFIQLAGKVDSDVAIILVGSLKQIMKLPENVIHIKETHNTKELSAYYSLADVYLHLSLEETFGKTIAEALACGTPAIVFNSTACPELIGEGCGHIVPPGDLQGTLIAIEKIRSLGKIHYAIYCREWAAKNFQKDKNIQQTIDIYNSLLHYAG